MEEIIKAFGLDSRLIIAQTINFAVLMVLLWYFLYKPVLSMLATREEKIKQGIADAEAAAAARTKAEEEKQNLLSAAHAEAKVIDERVRQSAEDRASNILSEAETKAGHILSEAERQGNDRKADLIKESEAEVAKLAILAAEKVLKERSG